MIDYQQYLDEKIHQLRIICQTQWDYLNYANLRTWLEDNFKNDVEGEYYMTKIILNTIYYKKTDIEKLLSYGLYHKIYGEIVKRKLIEQGNIYITSSEAETEVLKLKEKTLFMPLLNSTKPSESGNQMAGDIVHKLNIPEKQVYFHRDINADILKEFKILILVDDCIGTGNQLKKFWNSKELKTTRIFCNTNNIEVYYLVLVGYNKNIEKLKKSGNIDDVNIIVCDMLTDKHRIFSEKSTIWDKENDERRQAISYFENLHKKKGIGYLGYKKLDFAVILHDRLPNWALPLFWKKHLNWEILIKRKTSN